jgi:hypothetical protein
VNARAPFSTVLDEGVPETTEELAVRCLAIAEHFRFGRDGEGHAALPGALAGLEQAVRLGILSPESAAPVLTAMLAAFERQDLLLVADLLEWVVAPSLR